MTSKTILITGATDGIGRAAAKILRANGHGVAIHGRSQDKLDATIAELEAIDAPGTISTFRADLSTIEESLNLASEIADAQLGLDVIINNAGILKVANPITADGLDVRFAVNTIAPYILARALLPALPADGRIANIASAAQASLTPGALEGKTQLSELDAYSESKLAVIMWSRHMAQRWAKERQVVVSINPASLIDTNMARDAFGVVRNGLEVGADILVRSAISDEFANANGLYYDNDAKRFADPHPDALDPAKNAALVEEIERIIARHANGRDKLAILGIEPETAS